MENNIPVIFKEASSSVAQVWADQIHTEDTLSTGTTVT